MNGERWFFDTNVLVYLFDQETGEVTLHASQVPHVTELGRLSLKIGEGVTGWVAYVVTDDAGLAAFTVKEVATAVWDMIQEDLKEDGVTDMTASYGSRLEDRERCAYLRPMIVHCQSPENAIANKEFMFPFSTVVECPQDQMLAKIGATLVCSGITNDEKFAQSLSDAVHIDRLNIGPIPTSRLNWLQPHEGNIIDFLFRSRAYQVTEEHMAALA